MAHRHRMEVIARWRETGAWWQGETPKEFVQYRDSFGIKREKSRDLFWDSAGLDHESTKHKHTEVHNEDLSLRPRKLRDEKVTTACGYAPNYEPILGSNSSDSYVALHCYSGYSFGKSLLFARELPRRAAALGLSGVAITDWFSLAGALEVSREAKSCEVKALIGATLEMDFGGHLVVIARNREGYRRLSQLVTICYEEEPRLYPLCTWERLNRFGTDHWICLTGGDGGILNNPMMGGNSELARQRMIELINVFGPSQVFVEIERCWLPWETSVNSKLLDLAESFGLKAVAGGRVTHAAREDFPGQDILVCSDTLCLVDEVVGRKPHRHDEQMQTPVFPQRSLNSERFLRSPYEMKELFADRLDLLGATRAVADLVEDDVVPGRSELPEFSDDPDRLFVQAVMRGAKDKYGEIGRRLQVRLGHEMDRILKLGYSDHFLVAWEVCEWAKENHIQLSGRGSVVDSVVAYCLGISRIDGFAHRLHFDRFLPADGTKRPDIDIDFEARRRDDVRNHMIQKYGREHVATVGAFGAFCTRGIMREVGKCLGVQKEVIDFVAKRMHRGVSPDKLEEALQNRPELRNSGIDKERLDWMFKLGEILMDVPRNLRAHSSGVVVSRAPIADFVPLVPSLSLQDSGRGAEPLRVMQWDKRSAKHCFDKFDILCLRGQDVLGGAEQRIRVESKDFDVTRVAVDDPDVYRTMRGGHLVGIPQSASPAMRQAHMRIKTQDLTDASLVQAGIRPGVGGAVKLNELIARKSGTKSWSLEHPDLEPILGHTYGIIVFQEQVDLLLQVFAGYSGGEAEDIRDLIHHRRREDYGRSIRDELLTRIMSRGYTEDVAAHVVELVAGFKGYGFAQGHALAFAEISVRSIWCQQNYPAQYFASLLDAQPAGYYGPCTLVNEARNRGVKILPVDFRKSKNRFEVESVLDEAGIVVPHAGIRISLTQVKGVSVNTRTRMVEVPVSEDLDFFDFVKRVQPEKDELENLILCGAFDSTELNRRALLWAIPSALSYAKSEGGKLGMDVEKPQILKEVEDFSPAEKAIRERAILGLDIQQHLMATEREKVGAKGGISTQCAQTLRDGERAIVVGNPIRLRFPPTPSGKRVVFFDLEDETGLLNVTCFDRVYQLDGHAIVTSPYVTVIGHAQWRDDHMAFLAQRVYAYDPLISQLVDQSSHELPVTHSDFLVG